MLWKDEDGFLDVIKDEHKYGIFLDMGVGKTALLLALADYKFFNNVKRILIITPKKVSLSTWQNEIRKWQNFNYMESVVTLIDGNETQRIAKLKATGSFCIHIISSSLTEWLTGKYIKKKAAKSDKCYKSFIPNLITPQYDLIIVDECSQFKDVTTNRFKALKKLVKSELFLLSGTAFSNIKEETSKQGLVFYHHADELYYLFNLLELYKGSLTDFRNEFCYTKPWDEYNYRMSQAVYDTLISALNKHGIKKKLVLNVKLIEHKIYCPTDAKRMQMLRNEYFVKTNGFNDITAESKAIMINKALQLANGFVYDETGATFRINTNKFDVLKTLLSMIEDNVIIFYNFKEDREFLLNHLLGSRLFATAQDQDDWNAGKIKYLIISPFSGKFGLNLQMGGHTIIWFGLMWSAESYLQANKRIYRLGQSADVDVYYLMAEHSYDDYVYDTLISKVKAIDDFGVYSETL